MLVKSIKAILRKNSTGSDFVRRRINLIEGSNISITMTDDPTNDEIDVTIAGAGAGGVADGDKGDITVSGSGATWTIDNGAVTLAKQADMATASVVYRKTAGAGAPEVQSLATLKTDLGLTGTNTGDQTTIVGIAGTKAQFDTAVTDGNFLYVGDVTTNATHTGEVTGATSLTLDKTAISNRTDTIITASDVILFGDATDTGNLKKDTVQGILDLVPAAPTRDSLGLDTDDSPQFAGVNLGHATDTTITRVSAGVAAIEGNNIVTANMAASASDINTGTSTTVFNTPDALAGSEFGKRTVAVQVNGSASGSTALVTGDGQAVLPIDTIMNGMNVIAVKAFVTTVSSSGAVTVNIRRSRRSSATARTVVDILSTALTIDASEFESADATAAVINTANDDLITGDMLLIDIDASGTGVLGLTVLITAQLP